MMRGRGQVEQEREREKDERAWEEVVGEEIVGWKALWKEHEENL